MTKWITRSLKLRLRCQSDIITGTVDPSSNCISGDGAPGVQGKIERLKEQFHERLGSACADANLNLLSFPGPCAAETGFDAETLAGCLRSESDAIFQRLFQLWYPPDIDRKHGAESECLRKVPRRAGLMMMKEVRTRLRCLTAHERGELAQSVDCRAHLPPYGNGTQLDALDAAIRLAQRAWSTGLPHACFRSDFNQLGYGSSCTAPFVPGAEQTGFHACVSRANRTEVSRTLGLAFPTDAVCGNAVVQEEEECDDGVANSDTQPDACRLGCLLPFCGDATTDPGNDEQCDDGGLEDLDGCDSSCRRERCGDGIVNNLPNEACDDGNANPNDSCTSTCSVASCGDGVVCRDLTCTSGPGGGPELCDLGADNGPDAGCDTDCSGFARNCELTIGVTNNVNLGAISYELSYLRADGEFSGSGGNVECVSLLTGGLVSFFDNETKRTVKESLIVDAGFQAPRDIARCGFSTNDAQLSAASFPITVSAASTPDFEPASTTMAVTSISCLP